MNFNNAFMNETHVHIQCYIYTQHCGLEDMKAVNEINSFKAKFSICLFEEELIIRSSAFACLIGSKSIIKEKNEPTSKSFSRNTH